MSACSPPKPEVAIGEPLAGLDADELARFREGAALFDKVFLPEDGLGPLFNENQCSACHTDPASGGTGEQLVTKATRFTPPADCDLLSEEGGENIRRLATPLLRAHGIEREQIPASATERGHFTAPFLFGLGLVEAIPDAEILKRADPDDADGDGISGRAGRTVDGRVGRFSRKAELATITDFTISALVFEMGLTTPGHPQEPGLNARPLPDGVDPAPDPEVGAGVIGRLSDFIRYLAPPARQWPEGEAARAQVAQGERLFAAVGCAACHTPVLRTGRSPAKVFDRKPVALYSDLLLHDLGPELANVCGLGATPAELRTAPLMGLRHRRVYLHDGRTGNLFEAIRLHAGEASASVAAFDRLSRLDQEAVIRFLGTL